MAEEAKWYVVHTYSGYENKVKADIEKTIENRNLQDQIHEVMIPLQTVMEEKNGEKKPVQKKVFPAYVLPTWDFWQKPKWLRFPLAIMLLSQREYGRILTALFRKFIRQNRWR